MKLRHAFFSGLVIVAPVATTLIITSAILRFVTRPFIALIFPYLQKTGITSWVPFEWIYQCFTLGLLVTIITLIGLIARRYLIRSLLEWCEHAFLHIPIINKVYAASREVIRVLFTGKATTFQRVALVPFPKEGVYSFGLVVSDCPKACQKALKEDLVSVFVPTTPNPTTGFILMFKRSEIVETSVSIEDALKYTISCGVVTPESIQSL